MSYQGHRIRRYLLFWKRLQILLPTFWFSKVSKFLVSAAFMRLNVYGNYLRNVKVSSAHSDVKFALHPGKIFFSLENSLIAFLDF